MENQHLINFIKSLYPSKEVIHLHEPLFTGREKELLSNCVDSTFVSTSGEYLVRFEKLLAEYLDISHVILTVNGTSALHLALKGLGVEQDDEVITQPLTFIATANAISYCGAHPTFIDVNRETLGLDPFKLKAFLNSSCEMRDSSCFNKTTGRKISACIPMHTFGIASEIEELVKICRSWNIAIIEDSAESLGSKFNNQALGTFGDAGVFSFNGNKIITTGGGGAICTNNKQLADRLRHLGTTAKKQHPYRFFHDEIGYNYRMTNINAAIGVAQMENLNTFLQIKNNIYKKYEEFFRDTDWKIVVDNRFNSEPNHWLVSILAPSQHKKIELLEYGIKNNVHLRGAWDLMTELPMYTKYSTNNYDNAELIYNRLINLPSGINGYKR